MVCPDAALLQTYVSVPVPPLTFATTVPVPLEQSGFVGLTDVIVGPPVLFINAVAVFVHAFASLTVTVYVDALKVFAVVPVAELLHE